jgi:hypothetical protein
MRFWAAVSASLHFFCSAQIIQRNSSTAGCFWFDAEMDASSAMASL